MTEVENQRRQRRLPTRGQLEVWRDYLETAELLRSRLASHLQSKASLSLGDYQVLLTLSEADDNRLRSSELAARIEWERSRLSHHLGRMEKRGLIQRQPCPDDSRGAEVVITAEGSQAFRAGSIPHLEAVRELFIAGLTTSELEQLRAITGSLRRHLSDTARNGQD